MIGVSIGPYQITDKLGAGGMVQDHVVIVSNFFDYLRAIAPVKK